MREHNFFLILKIFITQPWIPLSRQQWFFLNGVWQVRDFTVLMLFADFFWFWQILSSKCLVNLNITAMLTTKSPVSLEVSVQWTPELVVICFGTGLVCYSFVSERYTAALASRCLVTLILCWGSFKYKDKRNNKNTMEFKLSSLQVSKETVSPWYH